MTPRGLHVHAGLQSEIDAMLRRWRDDWNRLDELDDHRLTEAEADAKNQALSELTDAIARLEVLFNTNHQKRTTDWR